MQGTARTAQGKTRTRAVPTVYYHGRDNIDRIATLSIAGRIYDFYLTSQQLDTVEFLCRKVSALKAFNYARKFAQRTVTRST